ncbi:zeatin o-glucosyltransferase [Fagus crenata]
MAYPQYHQNHVPNGLNKTKVVVVMVPFPAQGHLNQLLHLCRLIMAYNIPVHYACTATDNRQAMLRVHGWDSNSVSDNIYFHDLEIPPFLSPPPNPNTPNKFPSHLQPLFNASLHLRDPMAELLRELSSKAARIIVINDSMMASVVQDMGTIPNAESYTFHSVSAFAFFLYLWESMGKKKPLEPKSKIIIPKDLPSHEDCFTNEFLSFVGSQYEFQKLSSGCLYNTCRIIEGAYMDLMEKLENKKQWAIGPFNPDWSRRNQLVTSKTIENAVKTLMASKEGDEMRKRTVDLGGAVRGSMDNGGVSRLELNSFITHITRLEMPVDTQESFPCSNILEGQELEGDHIIHLESSDACNEWRDNLAREMFDHWRASTHES